MSYAQLDDRLPHHKKVRSLPPKLALAAYGLYVASIQFCQHYETDGQIRSEDLHMLLPSVPKPSKKLTEALVLAGLWDEAGGGWFVHDYLEHNASAQERKAKAKHAAQTRWGRATGTATSNARGNARPDASPLHSSPLHSTPTPRASEGHSAPMNGTEPDPMVELERLKAKIGVPK